MYVGSSCLYPRTVMRLYKLSKKCAILQATLKVFHHVYTFCSTTWMGDPRHPSLAVI